MNQPHYPYSRDMALHLFCELSTLYFQILIVKIETTWERLIMKEKIC